MNELVFRRVRTANVVVFVVVALASTASTLPSTWRALRAQHGRYAPLTRGDPNVVPVYDAFLPPGARTFFRSRLERGERYYVHVEAGPLLAGVDRATGVRTFARFVLLPAVQVGEPSQADVVLGVAADPRALGLPFTDVAESEAGYFVARLRP